MLRPAIGKGDGPKYISVIATTKIPSQESLCGICLYFRQQGTADESAEQIEEELQGRDIWKSYTEERIREKWSKQLAAVDKTAIMREYCVWTAECFCLTTAG